MVERRTFDQLLADFAGPQPEGIKMSNLIETMRLQQAEQDANTARLPATANVVWMSGAGVPVDGTTGDDVAGPGYLYSDITNGNLYIQTAPVDAPVWKLVTRAA